MPLQVHRGCIHHPVPKSCQNPLWERRRYGTRPHSTPLHRSHAPLPYYPTPIPPDYYLSPSRTNMETLWHTHKQAIYTYMSKSPTLYS